VTFGPGAFGPDSPEVKATSKVKIAKEPTLGGQFYRGDYSVAKSKNVPMAFSGVFYLGYEPGTKQIANLSMDNTGVFSMALGPLSATTASWTGDAYVMGKKVKSRESMTKDGPKQVTHKYEIDMGKGFQTMGTDICKK
jgi:hypothetical protein